MLKKAEAQVKSIFDAKLPLEILDEFKPLEQDNIASKGTYVESATPEVLIINMQEKRASIITAIISLFCLIAFLLIAYRTNESFFHPVIILTTSLSVISLIFFSIKIFFKKKSLIILDRKNGMFSFPYRLQRYKLYKTEFNRAIVYWQGSGGVTGNLGISLIAQHPDKKVGGADLVAHVSGFRKIWSFYVWYMDKNRPLPPGTAFDPYRQADFERRKSEGFPKPLYRSYIPTPEATPAQQLERERYWKDELEEFTREPESEMYDPQVHKGWVSARWLNDDDSPTSNTYFKFEFDNGEIIYIKTDESGLGHKPSNDQKFTMTRMDLFESWF